MGFDITGLNPKNIKVKEPEQPKDLFQSCSKEEQDKYFDELDKYQSQAGTYFRNNIWWWRPLAHYVLEYTKVIDDNKKKYWAYNDHHIVNDKDAQEIAKQLKYLIKSGHTKGFAIKWDVKRKKLEDANEAIEKELSEFEREVCLKLNKKNLAPRDFPKKDFKEWNRIYNKKFFTINTYPFSEKNVESFAEFCENSGGFEIG